MADNKKYYYLKLKEDFFDSDEMLLLQGMKDGYLYSDILMKMYLRSLKNEGRLMYKDYIPYSLEMISNSRVIEVPTISTTGRTDGDRDTIGTRKRNYNNEWKPLTLENHRQWQTLVHPRDIAETKGVVAIGNITKVYNEEQKFPEMNAYCISKLYADWTTDGAKTAHSEVLTEENVLTVFDEMMKNMDNKRVPRAGRILYVTPDVRTLINNAKQIYRTVDVGSRSDAIKRAINSIDDVKIPESVPSDMMKTKYDFTEGWKVDSTAKQINMVLVHPAAVITPISYEFAQLDPPSAGSQGKYDYFEESFEDVFILPHKMDAIDFHVSV